MSTANEKRRREWQKILHLERLTAKPEAPFAPPPKYNLCTFYMGKYYLTEGEPSESPCISYARALAYAFEHLPLTFHNEQEFLGGAETFRGDDLPEYIASSEYDEAVAAFAARPNRRSFLLGWSHTIPDYNTLMERGLGDFIVRAETAAGKLNTPESEGMLIALRAVSNFFIRAADAFETSRPEAAFCLRKLAWDKPDTFPEALQLMWLIFVLLESEGRGHNALGRVDQYLYRAYASDGVTHQDAIYYLCHIWAKIEGFHEVTNICIGGVSPDGTDAVNDLSYLVLEATALVHSASTNLSARFHADTSDEFLSACVELIRTGIGFPAVFNDEVNVRMLHRLGIPLEAARDYALVGCVECIVPGRQIAWSDGRFNLPEIFTGVVARLPQFASYQELWEAFADKVREGLERYRDEFNLELAAAPADVCPDPLLSALTRDCIARGCDLNGGGSEFMRLHGIGMVGLATMVDSLTAIKKLIFEERRIEPESLVKALNNNFKDNELLRQTLINCAPKYGNDDDYTNNIAGEIVALCGTLCEPLRTIDGGYLQSCMASNTSNIYAGQNTMATADGRYAGEPLSDAASPSAGRDRNGPTAFVNSIVSPDYAVQNCSVVNMRFVPEMFEAEDGKKRMRALFRRFIDGGGHEMQFNVTDSKMLEDAIRHPDKYADLIVRVSGFSAFFTKLAPEVQQDIMRRYAHGA